MWEKEQQSGWLYCLVLNVLLLLFHFLRARKVVEGLGIGTREERKVSYYDSETVI